MKKSLEAKKLKSLEINGIGKVAPGMMLEHPYFGLGEVEEIFVFVSSGENSIRINFNKYGSKALVPEYANLSLPKTKISGVSRLFKVFKVGR
ncbi:MAG: hypothetical protein KZQ77_03490 [Candidatus Thiodiazotropha sp. (ex Notomyrtea botanica)]|nr:hypothetical protein [Candidatus Thiodiazotropha sp. (ex Notomyrtea botanica)]